MPNSYYKIGQDVYGTQEGKLNQQQFQDLGLNYNLLGEGAGNAKPIDQTRDVETRSFMAGGGQLGQADAATIAGYTFDPTTGTLKTPSGSGTFGAGSVPTTEAINTATKTLFNKGAVTTSKLPQDQTQEYKNLEDRMKKSDSYVSSIMSAYVPTSQEQKIQAEIDATRGSAEAEINQEADRVASMSFITGAQASIERRANAKLAGLQRELTRLTGNREGQLNALKTAYDINRQSTQDAIAFYKATSPEKLAIDENSGTVYFMNPITSEVTASKLPGWTNKQDTTYATNQSGKYPDAGIKPTDSLELVNQKILKSPSYVMEQAKASLENKKLQNDISTALAQDQTVHPDVLQGMLNIYKATGVLPAFGLSAKSPLRAQFYAALGADGGIVNEANTNKSVRAGLTAAYRVQQTQLSANQTAITTLDKQLDLAKTYSDKVSRSGSPLIAKYILGLKSGTFGDPDTAALNNIVKSASYEFAKILSGASASIAGVTVSSTADAEALLNSAMSKGQFNSVIALMKKEAQFRLTSQADTLKQLEKDMQNISGLSTTLTLSEQVKAKGYDYNAMRSAGHSDEEIKKALGL